MMEDARIERLRGLIAAIERAPRSPERDRLLREVRDRMVTLQSGVEKSTAFGIPTADTPQPPDRQRLSDILR